MYQTRQNTASTPMVFAKFSFVLAFFASVIFAKKFANYERKLSHFYAKRFVRIKPYLGSRIDLHLMQICGLIYFLFEIL